MRRLQAIDRVRAVVSVAPRFWSRFGAGDPAGAMLVLLVRAKHEGGLVVAVRYWGSDYPAVMVASGQSHVIVAATALVHR